MSQTYPKVIKMCPCLQLSQPFPLALRHLKTSEGFLEVCTFIFGQTAGVITAVTLTVLFPVLMVATVTKTERTLNLHTIIAFVYNMRELFTDPDDAWKPSRRLYLTFVSPSPSWSSFVVFHLDSGWAGRQRRGDEQGHGSQIND